MDSRAVSAVVEKLVAIGLVTLFVSGVGAALLGGVVPAYRTSAADELAERSLATVADSAEAAVPDSPAVASVTSTVTVPATVAGSTYRLELTDRRLQLRHPEPALRETTRLAIPTGVNVQNGSVAAGTVQIRVNGGAGNRTLTLEAG